MICNPAGASSREFSDRQGVSRGAAINVPPAATRSRVVAAESATSKATLILALG